jgi:hypothetical protein
VKALAIVAKISLGWRQVHLNGHYIFRGDGKLIDLDAVTTGLDLA